jgi:hypothetical protein
VNPFAAAQAVANAVLYEGYVLYPYRASSAKNRTRWQWGVLMPAAYVADDPSERSSCRTEVVAEPEPGATLTVQVRFLDAARRPDGWADAVERAVQFELPAQPGRAEHPFGCDGDQPLAGVVLVEIRELPGPYGAVRITIEVVNRTASTAADRDAALEQALIATHTLGALDRGVFLSMTDPPEWAKLLVGECANSGTWPVLIDDDTVVLSSPIILEDHPRIAPESPGDLYDACEIDEILTLRTMTLTDAEKAEARATDPRAAAVIDRVDGLPQDHLDRLHGALRYLRNVTGDPEPPRDVFSTDAPWWDPGADASVDPETDVVEIDGIAVARGSMVRLHPGGRSGSRRTDAQDLFLRGRTATVEAVLLDVDGNHHIAVTPADDPELAEVARWHGRYLYFTAEEIEPVVGAVR